MSRAVILNFTGTFVEIVDIPEEYIIHNIDGKMSGEEILAEMGYNLHNIQYMFVDGPVLIYENGNGKASFAL